MDCLVNILTHFERFKKIILHFDAYPRKSYLFFMLHILESPIYCQLYKSIWFVLLIYLLSMLMISLPIHVFVLHLFHIHIWTIRNTKIVGLMFVMHPTMFLFNYCKAKGLFSYYFNDQIISIWFIWLPKNPIDEFILI